jgi:hypothetical protein
VPDLHARKIAVHVPACETGQHVMHPMETCEEYEAFSAHVRAYFADVFGALGTETPMSEVPPGLRGPNWKAQP